MSATELPMDHKTITLSVPGMTCGHCEAAVKAQVGNVPGVASVDVDLDSKDVVVTGDTLDLDALVNAVDEAGYEAAVHREASR